MAPQADPTTRLRTALRRLAADLPEPVDLPDDTAAAASLHPARRLRYDLLARATTALRARRAHDGLHTEELLALHSVAGMWLEELAGRPDLQTTPLYPADRVLVDLTVALLLWHLTSGPDAFFATQRLVQFCLLDLEHPEPAAEPVSASPDTATDD